MDLDKLKENYNDLKPENNKPETSLKNMKKSGKNPVLRGIKRQLIFETIVWAFLLIVFYDFFDGHLKSFFWNIALIVAIVFLLAHNFLGFTIVKTPINSDNLKDSLTKYLTRIRSYSYISIASRIIAVATFMGFLMSTASWDTNKIWTSVVAFLLLITIQIFALNKVWGHRITIIKEQILKLQQ